MIKITNVSPTFHAFATSAGTVEVLPGDTRNVEVEAEDPTVKAKVAAGLIRIGEADSSAVKAEPIGVGAAEEPGKAESRRGRRGAAAAAEESGGENG